MSFGYCQTYTDQLDPSSADTRYLIGSGSLPSSIRLLGFSFFHSVAPSSLSANRFKLFDGTSSSSIVWNFPMYGGFLSWSTNQNSLLMIDDSFVKIINGLAYEVTSTDFSTSSYPINVTVFYC